ncbi:Ubiquitin-conjugating enzyme E2 J1, partial [Sorochytrium milnesiophthora]
MTSIKSPAVRRIMKELQEMEQDRDTPQYRVTAVEDNLLELHFTISGPADSPYATGRYHGRILCPPEYPYQPPEILLLTVVSILLLMQCTTKGWTLTIPFTASAKWTVRSQHKDLLVGNKFSSRAVAAGVG